MPGAIHSAIFMRGAIDDTKVSNISHWKLRVRGLMRAIPFAVVVVLGVSWISALGQNVNEKASHDVSFTQALIAASPVLYPQSITAGDLNHDGRADLGVVGDEQPGLCTTVEVLSLPHTGGLGSWACVQPGGADAPMFVTFADINRDGNLDAVSTDADLPVVAVGIGNGKGRFPNGENLQAGACGYSTQQMAIADLNGDVIPDIVATVLGVADNPGCLAIFLGQGNGVFSSAHEISSGGNTPFSVAVGDLNHDGIPDLVVANFGDPFRNNFGNVSILMGNGDGTFQSPVIYSGLIEPSQVALADFNGDGNLDLVIIAAKKEILVALGKGDGTFLKPTAYPVPRTPGPFVLADFNGDGKLDIAMVGTGRQPPGSGAVGIMLGNGDGTFQPPVLFRVGDLPNALAVGDFNGDGRPDIAVLTVGASSTISILLNTTPWPNKGK